MHTIEAQDIYGGYGDHVGKILKNVEYYFWSIADQINGKEDPQKIRVFLPDETETIISDEASPLPFAIIQFFRIPYEFGIEGYMYYYLTKQQRNDRDELLFNCLYVSIVNPQEQLWDFVLNPELQWKKVEPNI